MAWLLLMLYKGLLLKHCPSWIKFYKKDPSILIKSKVQLNGGNNHNYLALAQTL